MLRLERKGGNKNTHTMEAYQFHLVSTRSQTKRKARGEKQTFQTKSYGERAQHKQYPGKVKPGWKSCVHVSSNEDWRWRMERGQDVNTHTHTQNTHSWYLKGALLSIKMTICLCRIKKPELHWGKAPIHGVHAFYIRTHLSYTILRTHTDVMVLMMIIVMVFIYLWRWKKVDGGWMSAVSGAAESGARVRKREGARKRGERGGGRRVE